MATIGHNTIAGGELKSLIERIERLDEERKAIANDIKDVFAEAKGKGFDPKIMKRALALRKQDPNKRREEQDVLDTYLRALGMEG